MLLLELQRELRTFGHSKTTTKRRVRARSLYNPYVGLWHRGGGGIVSAARLETGHGGNMRA